MGDCTLLFRHLPSSLSKEEKEDFLLHFGAVKVAVMGNTGPMKHAAFAEFPSKEIATQVLSKLHQVEMLGCRLVVVFATGKDAKDLPPLTNTSPSASKKETEKEEQDEETKKEELNDRELDFSFHHFGLEYCRRRKLHYLYPPPTAHILTNISHALAACPRFYVQVLHLMNKMDLPPPFGPLTAQPPLAPDANESVDLRENLQTEEMDVSSTEESEIESDAESAQNQDMSVAASKRRLRGVDRQIRKRARLAVTMLQAPPPPGDKPRPPASMVAPLTEVFEQLGEGGSQRRIQLKLPSAVTATGSAVAPGNERLSDPYLTSALPLPLAPEPSSKVRADEETTQSTGFGVITPASKPAEENQDENTEESTVTPKFISRSELSKGRLSSREMKEHSVFRNYQAGEANRRLYIKNLARQVTEEDLQWIFGRYIDWEKEEEKNMFDIRLMKEGRMKGQAFVTLSSEEQAAKAVHDANAFVLKGKPIVVLFARSAKPEEKKP